MVSKTEVYMIAGVGYWTFVTVIRPRIPAPLWAQTGLVGTLIDAVIAGNTGHCKNTGGTDRQDAPVPVNVGQDRQGDPPRPT